MFDNIILSHAFTLILSSCIMVGLIYQTIKNTKKVGWTVAIITAMLHSIVFYIAMLHDGIFHDSLLYSDDFVVSWSATKNLHLYISLCIYFVGKAYALRYIQNDTC